MNYVSLQKETMFDQEERRRCWQIELSICAIPQPSRWTSKMLFSMMPIEQFICQSPLTTPSTGPTSMEWTFTIATGTDFPFLSGAAIGGQKWF
jgi:hypothetical protein